MLGDRDTRFTGTLRGGLSCLRARSFKARREKLNGAANRSYCHRSAIFILARQSNAHLAGPL